MNILLAFCNVRTGGTEMMIGVNVAFSQNSAVKQGQLSPMNRIPIPSFSDTSNNKNGRLLKLLIIGNSLTRHGIAENIGWTHVGGMAATSSANDFAHLIFKKAENLLPDRQVRLRLSNFADFERNLASFDFKSMDSLISFRPDIIIFQLGENVSFNEESSPPLFEKKYTELINCFKTKNHPLVICTTPFFPSIEKNEIIGRVVLATHSYLADLSHLPLMDKQNYAKDEIDYAGDRSGWKVSGIGAHPGDYGMRNIAREIFIIINAHFDQELINRN